MRKNTTHILFVLFVSVFVSSNAFADTIPIDQSICTVIDYSSSGPNNKPDLLFDDNIDTKTAWSNYDVDRLWKLLPAYVVVDLGEEKSINGINCETHKNSYASHIRKPSYTKVYVTNDTADWGDPQLKSMFQWTMFDINDKQIERRELFFGAKKGRYVKVVFGRTHIMTYSFKDKYNTADKRIWLRDMFFYENTDGESAKINPVIEVTDPGIKESVNDPFDITCSVNTNQSLITSIESGPATMASGTNTVTLTGDGGFVVVKCEVEENDTHNSAANYIVVPVLDIKSFFPAIKTSLSSYPLVMGELQEFPIAFYVDSLPDYVKTESVSVNINGIDVDVEEVANGYVAYWTPDDYGYHNIMISTVADNGNTDENFYNIYVTDQATDIDATGLEREYFSYKQNGQSKEYTIQLPMFADSYKQVIAKWNLNWPNNNRDEYDEWDRAARVWVRKKGQPWVEIIRYVTAYWVECGTEVDVTDYMNLLQGEVDIRINIDTWAKGFDISLDFEYVAGEATYDHIKVTPIWDGKFNFGNYANLQPVPEVKVGIDTNVAGAKLKLITTGHGWGDNNTGNASEFYHAYHTITVNEAKSFEQDLWADCNPNPDNCIQTAGSWMHDRAGWCPGAKALVYEYDINDQFNANDEVVDSVSFKYVFDESYVDLCHPNHPDCETGLTCDDCNDTHNPSYYVSGNLIEYLKQPATDPVSIFNAKFPIDDLNINVYPTVGNGEIKVDFDFDFEEATLEVVGVNGRTISMYVFYNTNALKERTFDFSHLNSGVYFVRVATENGVGTHRFVIE